MKQRALDVAIGRVANSLALIEWKTYEKNKFKRDDLFYHLNFQPNINQNATDFWAEVVRKLFYEKEVLILVTNEDYFIVADDFETKKFVLKENIYTNIQKDDLNFDRSFSEKEVIHLTYRNSQLKKILNDLDESYGMLFDRLVKVAMRTSQIRGTAKLTGSLANNDKAQEYLQTFVDKIFKNFEEKSVAVVPIQDGMEYNELTREQNTRSQVDEMTKVFDEYLKAVLEAVGIHPSLISGDMSDISHHQNNYISNVVQPIVEQIADEINRKFFTKEELFSGNILKPSVFKLRYISIFDIGTQAAQLVGSTIANPNQVRNEAGLDELDVPELNNFYMTKNHEKLTMKGGDENKQETS